MLEDEGVLGGEVLGAEDLLLASGLEVAVEGEGGKVAVLALGVVFGEGVDGEDVGEEVVVWGGAVLEDQGGVEEVFGGGKFAGGEELGGFGAAGDVVGAHLLVGDGGEFAGLGVGEEGMAVVGVGDAALALILDHELADAGDGLLGGGGEG